MNTLFGSSFSALLTAKIFHAEFMRVCLISSRCQAHMIESRADPRSVSIFFFLSAIVHIRREQCRHAALILCFLSGVCQC